MRSRTRFSLAFVVLISMSAVMPASAAPRDDDQPRTFVQRIVRVVRLIQHLIVPNDDSDSGTISVPKP